MKEINRPTGSDKIHYESFECVGIIRPPLKPHKIDIANMPAVPCDLLTATIKDLQRLLLENKTSSVDLVKAYLVGVHTTWR